LCGLFQGLLLVEVGQAVVLLHLLLLAVGWEVLLHLHHHHHLLLEAKWEVPPQGLVRYWFPRRIRCGHEKLVLFP
jgi:hypothetical protein